MAATTPPEGAPSPHLSAKQALIMTPIVLVLLIAFIALNLAVGSAEVYVGFFFALYWTGIQKGSFAELPAAVAGGFFGLILAFLLHLMVATWGVGGGSLAFLALLAPVLFCQLAGYVPLIINNATMLLLTAATISHVQANARFPGMFISLALAVAFFGGLLWLGQVLQARSQAGKSAGPAA